jgi:altronate hydrolase
MSRPPFVLRVHPNDNVAVLLRPGRKGESVPFDGPATLLADIPVGHKVALSPIAAGAVVVKYGFPIGRATRDIAPGEWVHEHNLRSGLDERGAFVYRPFDAPAPTASAATRTFDGFERPDGSVGVRNEIWIIPTVGCVNKTAEELARRLEAEGLPEGVEGVVAFSHPYGCSQLGGDHENTRRVLAGLALHPNAAGVLVLGLGCENNTMASFRALLEERAGGGAGFGDRLRYLVAQEVEDELESGMELLRDLADRASRFRRVILPLSRLRVGLKCGGSDAFSGLTANPLVGRVSDLLLAQGAATVLTEVPEMFGAESVLLDRCANRGVFDEAVAMIDAFKDYYVRHGEPVYENPSPGNREGGITTLEEKSIGCVQKGGRGAVTASLGYGATGLRAGLNLLDGPGNDIVSTTNLAASGAQLVLFTTGRGTPLGGPVPTLKISSNSALALKKPAWIDFDAGPVLEGADMDALAGRLLDLLVETASGRTRARNERNRQRDIAIWKNGVTL